MSVIKEIFIEHKTYGKQIFKLAKADLIKTYRGSALGWAWALVKPVVTIFVFWFAFSIGLRAAREIDGFPFFFWLIAGFVPWFYMQKMITGGAGCIRINRHLVTKMKFPISVIPTFTSLSNIAVHIVLVVIMLAIYVFIGGYPPDLYYLNILFWMVLMFIWFTIWALFAGMLSAISSDFYNLVKSLVQALFWMSGIIYDVSKINIPWLRSILSYNPVTIIATGYRHSMVNKIWFFEDLYMLRCYCICLFVIIVLAIWAYKKLYKDIPDVL